MNHKFFWNDWTGVYSWIYKTLLFLFVVSGLIFGLAYIGGTSEAIHWVVNDSVERLVVQIDEFDIDLFTIDILADNYLVFQEYAGSELQLNTWSTIGLLVVSGIFLILYFSITPSLGRFWYFIFTSFGIVLLLSLKFEQLYLFDTNNNSGFIIALLFYIPLSYYFHAFGRSRSLVFRLIAFTLSTLLLTLLIYLKSEVEQPFLILGFYGISFPITITAIFILITAQEFIYIILRIITGNSSQFSKNNVIHFTVLSLVYILNLILVWLKNIRVIDWDIVYLDAFLLFPIAAVLGIWGFKAKAKTLAGAIPFKPWGGILYLVFGITSFLTLSYFFYNANDPVVEAFEDLIIYSQFGLGLLFFIYIIANFFTLIDNNMQVYKVVYDPKRMPFITANIAGIIGMVALFAKSDFLAYDQIKSGYYNGLGDFYSVAGDGFGAESYYELGVIHAPINHRSSYALASLHQKRNNKSDALFFYEKAISKKPTPQGFVNLASIHHKSGSLFDAIFILQDGLKEFPDSGEIMNNLGLLYAETNILDSAAYYFNKGITNSRYSDTGTTNLLGLISKNSSDPITDIQSDSLINVYKENSSLTVRNNLLVLFNQTGLRMEDDYVFYPKDSLFTGIDLALTGNQLINKRSIPDTTLIRKLVQFKNSYSLGSYEEELKFSMAIKNYYSGYISEAIQGLYELYQSSFSFREKFGLVLGKLLMQQEAFTPAVNVLSQTGISLNLKRNLAISLCETGQYQTSIPLWSELVISDSSDQLSQHMLGILQLSEVPETKAFDDRYKFLLIKYRPDFDQSQLSNLASSIQNEFLKPMAFLNLYKHNIQSNPKLAEIFYDSLRSSNPIEGFVSMKHLLAELERLEDQGKWADIRNILLTLDPGDVRLVWMMNYYQAMAYMEDGLPEAAKVHFDFLSRNPYYEQGLIEAVTYYNEEMNDPEKAYNVILEAMQLNSTSIPILKTYVDIAVELGLDTYADDILLSLRELMEKENYDAFFTEIEAKRSSILELEF